MAGLDVLIGQAKKCLINRVNLQIAHLIAQQFHHSIGQVAIQDVACRELDDVIGIGIFFYLECRAAHGDAGGLGLVAAGNNAAVVV